MLAASYDVSWDHLPEHLHTATAPPHTWASSFPVTGSQELESQDTENQADIMLSFFALASKVTIIFTSFHKGQYLFKVRKIDSIKPLQYNIAFQVFNT